MAASDIPPGIPVLTKLRRIFPEVDDTCPCLWIEYSSSEMTSFRISSSFVCSMVSKHVWTSTLTKYNFGLWTSQSTQVSSKVVDRRDLQLAVHTAF